MVFVCDDRLDAPFGGLRFYPKSPRHTSTILSETSVEGQRIVGMMTQLMTHITAVNVAAHIRVFFLLLLLLLRYVQNTASSKAGITE